MVLGQQFQDKPMEVKGKFEQYKPENLPDDHPFKGYEKKVLFARDTSSGLDWYLFQKTLSNDSSKIFVWTETGDVACVVQDASLVFPAGMTLIENDTLIEDSDLIDLKWVNGAWASTVTVESKLAQVDQIRDTYIAAGFDFNGHVFQSRPEDLINISGVATAATAAIISGAAAGSYRWADPNSDFAWLDTSNVPVPMDAQTFIQLGAAAMKHKSALIWIGRSIKDRILAGEVLDPTDPDLWE